MLKVEGLRAAYGKVPVLHGISLEVLPGRLVTLLGANGAGKTTTLKAVSGLVKPLSGTICLQGERIDGLPSNRIVRLGISHCPEGRKVWPFMTVRENLELGGYLLPGRSLAERLEAVHEHFPVLHERRGQLAGSLSGGEQQMLAIGRALMPAPRLLLLDEPSMGLAPLFVERIGGIIRSIRLRGTTVLLVEQNAYLALGLADRGYIMETGRIVSEGEAEGFLSDDYLRRAYLGA